MRNRMLPGLRSLVVCVIGAMSIAGGAVVSGQSPPQNDAVVEVSASELEQIQRELDFLRSQEARRTERERSAFQLAAMGMAPSLIAPASCDSPDCFGSCDSCTTCDGCRLSGCDGCDGCGGGLCNCLCHSCQCPLPQAPCVDCPRVTTASPYFNINLFGALKLDMLFNSARPISPGTPFYLTPQSPFGLGAETVSFHARQSTLGANLAGPTFCGMQSGGQVMAMFFNDNVIADQYGLLPLQAFGELKNNEWRVAAGLLFDVFAPGAPTVLPFSALGASGNAGNGFRGQLRVERFLRMSNSVQWTLQAALSEPITSTIDPTFRVSEDNGWPNVEGRIALGLGAISGCGATAAQPFQLGLSGLVGEIRTTDVALPPERVVSDVWGAAIDCRWRVNDRFGFSGEIFTGKTLGTYNAGVLQNINAVTLDGIRSKGGFGEVYFYLTPCLHSHTGYGIDNPDDGDVANPPGLFGVTENQTVYTNLLWDVNASFRIACELTYRKTEYKSPFLLDENGTGFHTQLQWSF